MVSQSQETTILKLGLEKILLAIPQKFKPVRLAFEATLERLASAGNESSPPAHDIANYWALLKSACDPTLPAKAQELSLDLTQKLIANGLFVSQTLMTFAPDATFPKQTRAEAVNGTEDAAARNADVGADADSSEKATSFTEPPTVSSESMASSQSSHTTLQSTTASTSMRLIDDMIHVAAECYSHHSTSHTPDENIQLQILKVFLTAVTIPACEVHGRSLDKIFKVCNMIHLHAKTPTNQITAKASLMQMTNTVFGRMESCWDDMERLKTTTPILQAEREMQDSTCHPRSETFAVPQSFEAFIANPSNQLALSDTSRPSPELTSMKESQLDPSAISLPLSHSQHSEPNIETETDSKPENDTAAATTTTMSTSTPTPTPCKAVPLQKQIDDLYDNMPPSCSLIAPSLFGYCSQCYSPATGWHPTLQLPVCNRACCKTESVADIDSSSQQCVSMAAPFRLKCLSLYHDTLRDDCVSSLELLFEILKYHDRKSPSIATPPHSNLGERAKILALELILSILNNAGPAFRREPIFIDMVRNQLCLSLSANGLSPNPIVFELCLSLFLTLLHYFRAPLKTQIEVLFNEIYFHLLSLPNVSLQQRVLVLHGFQKICSSPQLLLDIYVNYDCDLPMESIYEKLIYLFGSILQSDEFFLARKIKSASIETATLSIADLAGLMDREPSSSGNTLEWGTLDGSPMSQKEALPIKARGSSRQHDTEVRIMAIKCFIAILHSLVEWMQEGQSASPPPPPPPPPSLPPRCSLSESNGSNNTEPASPSPSLSLSPSPSHSSPSPSLSGSEPLPTPLPPSKSSHASQTRPGKPSTLPIVFQKNPLSLVQLGQFNSRTASTTRENEDMALIAENKSKKQLLRQGVFLFNTSKHPMEGLNFLVQHGFIDDHAPSSIARFLLSSNSIDKKSLGAFLGEGDPKNVLFMHAFIDCLDFYDMPFVSALRYLLASFRLPGESQKIDRIMEKFADRYCECNPSCFSNADIAYTLSYSIIMLNTDLHSSQIRSKMTKESFIKNNRNIHAAGSSEVTDELLATIYDNILDDEIILDEPSAYFKRMAQTIFYKEEPADEQTQEVHHRETLRVKAKSEALFKEARVASSFKSASRASHVRPMFELLLPPLLGALAYNLASLADASAKEQEIIRLLLSCFVEAISLSVALKADTELDILLWALSQATHCHKASDLKLKSLWSIKALLHVASMYGNALSFHGWREICRCISQLDHLRLFEAPIDSSASEEAKSVMTAASTSLSLSPASPSSTSPFSAPTSSSSSFSFLPLEKDRHGPAQDAPSWLHQGTWSSSFKAVSQFPYFRKKSLSLAHVQQLFQEQDILRLIDSIFTNSTQLNGNAILSFFRALCVVSLEELGLPSEAAIAAETAKSGLSISVASAAYHETSSLSANAPPRIFCLQKIVEISYYNMGRIRLEWSQIWKILQPHFNQSGLHPDRLVCRLAVDALRQLSMKFLERDELAHYHTQNELLRSFEHIMRHTTVPEVRDLVLSSFDQMISFKAKNIKSGWITLLSVLSRALQFPDLQLTTMLLLHKIQEADCFACILANGFVDYVSTLTRASCLRNAKNEDINMRALKELKGVYLRLKGNGVNGAERENDQDRGEQNEMNGPNTNVNASSSTTLPMNVHSIQWTEEKFHLQWLPVLNAFSIVVRSCPFVFIRSQAVDFLFLSLSQSRELLQPYWSLIYRAALFPIFDDILCEEKLAQLEDLFVETQQSAAAPGEKNDASNGAISTLPLSPCSTISTPSYGASAASTKAEAASLATNSAVWIHALRQWIDLISLAQTPLLVHAEPNSTSCSLFLTAFLMVLEECTHVMNEHLAQSSILCIYHLVQKNKSAMQLAEWTIVVQLITRLLDWTMPLELMSTLPDDPASPLSLPSPVSSTAVSRHEPIDFNAITLKCALHLGLLQLVKDTASLAEEPTERAASPSTAQFASVFHQSVSLFALLTQALYKSHVFARDFNADLKLRASFSNLAHGASKPSLEGLVLRKQEVSSMTLLLHLLAKGLSHNVRWDDDDTLHYLVWPLHEHSLAILKAALESLSLPLQPLPNATEPHITSEIESWLTLAQITFQLFADQADYFPLAKLARFQSVGSHIRTLAELALSFLLLLYKNQEISREKLSQDLFASAIAFLKKAHTEYIYRE